MKVFMLPYQAASEGCKVMAEALGVKRIKLKESKFKPGNDKLVINWGNSRIPINDQPNWINRPDSVRNATNKLDSFYYMSDHEVPLPEWTTSYNMAKGWLNEGKVVMARTKLVGSQGEGIVVMEHPNQFVEAPLYTVYFKARDEYRVHVMDGKVFDVQQKRKRADVEEANFKIRSHDNGFVFCRDNVNLPPCCAEAAIAAVAALGLEFGAVDLRYNQHYDKCAVLEVNTAPGLEGTTLDKYFDAFGELLRTIGV